MNGITRLSATLLCCALVACGEKDEQPAPMPSSAPQVTVETRPANQGRATTADHQAAIELMLANANVPAKQVEDYARRNGIAVEPARIEAKRNSDRAMQGRPKLVAGEEYLASDPAAGQDMAGPAARPRMEDGGPVD